MRSTTYLFSCPCHTNICSPITVYPFGGKYLMSWKKFNLLQFASYNYTVVLGLLLYIQFLMWTEISPTLWQESFTDYTHCSPPFLQHFDRCEKWKQFRDLNWEPVTNDYNCPLMSLTPSENKLYRLYISATPMFSWNATVHVEWNVRTLKLIDKLAFQHDWTNLFYCYIYCMNWILFLHLYWPLTV